MQDSNAFPSDPTTHRACVCYDSSRVFVLWRLASVSVFAVAVCVLLPCLCVSHVRARVCLPPRRHVIPSVVVCVLVVAMSAQVQGGNTHKAPDGLNTAKLTVTRKKKNTPRPHRRTMNTVFN